MSMWCYTLGPEHLNLRPYLLPFSVLVGSRSGAWLRSCDLAVAPRFLWECLTSRGPGRWPGQSEKELGSTERFLHSLVEQQATEVGRLSSGVLYNTDH
jgi:hypothetical protein